MYNFIEEKFPDKEDNYFHTYKNNIAKYPAFLDDYTYLVDACIHLQEITADEKYLYKAEKITTLIFENFEDKESAFFFFTTKQQEDVVVRKIEIYDSATPSANSMMAKNLIYLSHVFNNKKWHLKAITMIDSIKNIIVKHPGSFAIWCSSAMNIAAGINEIVVIGDAVTPALQEVLLEYLPNKILQANIKKSDMFLLKDRPVLKDLSIYLCWNFTCAAPLSSVNHLLDEIQLQIF